MKEDSWLDSAGPVVGSDEKAKQAHGLSSSIHSLRQKDS